MTRCFCRGPPFSNLNPLRRVAVNIDASGFIPCLLCYVSKPIVFLSPERKGHGLEDVLSYTCVNAAETRRDEWERRGAAQRVAPAPRKRCIIRARGKRAVTHITSKYLFSPKRRRPMQTRLLQVVFTGGRRFALLYLVVWSVASAVD